MAGGALGRVLEAGTWDGTRAGVQAIRAAKSLLGPVSSPNWRCPKADSYHSYTVVEEE